MTVSNVSPGFVLLLKVGTFDSFSFVDVLSINRSAASSTAVLLREGDNVKSCLG